MIAFLKLTLVWAIFLACVLGTGPVVVILTIGAAVMWTMRRRIIAYLFILALLIGLTADIVIPQLLGRM